MDKQQEAAVSDSISTVGVTVKDYPPSEVYSSEPPPAYVRPRATAVQVARIISMTVIAVSFILGGFILASTYVTAKMSCQIDQGEFSQQQTVEDRPTFQHLVDPLETEETTQGKNVAAPPAEDGQEKPVQIKLPLQLDFDEIAGSLMEKNQKARMNCVVEKRRAEEVMDHQPKTVQLPFGLNLTTDPRYEHITGERMAIFCESGNEQRHVPMEPPKTPIMIPVPVPHPVPVQRMMHHPPPPPPQQLQGHQFMARPYQPFVQHPPQHLFQQAQPQMVHQIPPQMIHQIPTQQVLHHAQRMQPQAAALHLQQMRPPHPEEHVIREEHVIPVLQIETEELVPEARGFQHPAPSESVKPPPPQFHRLPTIHIPVQQQLDDQPIPQEQPRPHYVQPRSVRSVDSVLHRRDKRVRRCACDCSC